MKICSYCGAQIPDDSRFCIECGKRLQDPDPGPDFMSEILSQSEPDPAAQAESGKGSSSAPQQGGGIDADAVKDTIHDVAEKTFQSARAFAGQINDTVEKQKDGRLQITTKDGEMILLLDEQTPLTPYRTKNIVGLDDIKQGDRLLVWYSIVGISYPAKVYPEHVMLLPNMN